MGGKVIFFKKFEGLEMRFSVKMNSSLLTTDTNTKQVQAAECKVSVASWN
jgi:hypothetical protein